MRTQPHSRRRPAASPDARESLADLYRRIDAETERLCALHAGRLRCARGCSMCCVDDITVAEVEADHIRRHHAALLATRAPHPAGMCAFLDGEGACRIYEQRPYVCRTEGLPLRWIDQGDDGRVLELRDVCPLNESGEPVEELPAGACWSIGWVEQALSGIQGGPGGSRRVALRDLFAARAEGGGACENDDDARRGTGREAIQGEPT